MKGECKRAGPGMSGEAAPRGVASVPTITLNIWTGRGDRPDEGVIVETSESEQTSGSGVREARPLMERLLTLGLRDEVEALRREPAWQDGDRNSRTLAKAGDLRVLLSALRAGATIHEADAEGPATVQILEGRVIVSVAGEAADLGAGQLAAMDAGEAWSLEAAEESVVLLTLSWGGR